MIKRALVFSLQIGLVVTIIGLLLYIVTWDIRIDRRLKILDRKQNPTIDAPLPKPVIPDPHAKQIDALESHAGMPLSRIAKLIIAEEGIRSEPYLDTKGIVTIGIGRSLQTNGISTDELRAIIPNLNYDLLIDNASIEKGRIKIESIDLAKRIFTKPLTHHDMHLLLVDDLKNTKADAVNVFGNEWQKIDNVRKEAILDILYNLGLTHFKTFTNFIEAVKKHNWNQAASELLLSEAARQNYSRYNHVALVIDTGNDKYFNNIGEYR